MPQLWHVGAIRRPGTGPDPTIPGVGPVAVSGEGDILVRAMTTRDIEDVVASYARAAADAERIGFDGVEIQQAAHGYLLDQFLWPVTNRRDDAYGGSPENRVRFAVEVVRAMRRAVSVGFPIIFRFSQWKMSDYDARIASSPDELAALLRPLAEAGVDVFHASTRRFWEPRVCRLRRQSGRGTRRLTQKTVIAVGSVGLDKPHQSRLFRTSANLEAASMVDLDSLVEQVRAGAFDLIAIGRAVLADPEWVNKVRRGELQSIQAYTKAALDELR